MAQFTNQASITYNGITSNSNIVTGEVTQVINIWKDAVVDSYRSGDILTYVVSLQNSGSSAFTDLTLTDNLGAYTFDDTTLVPLTYTGDPVLYYINGILQTTPSVTAGPPLVITNLSVPAGLSSVLIYRVRVNSYAPLSSDSTIDNTVTLSGGGISNAITATETVTPNSDASLTITKAVNPTTVVENGQIIYTFTITNTGSTAADESADLVISDTFDPILSNISVTLNGSSWPMSSNYTYNSDIGAFATVEGRVTVPAATYSQDETTGEWSVTPGVTTLTVTGTI